MAKILTVQNAEINTASITIRTLQVEGRQVTLSVFRQIQKENILSDHPLCLRGFGWGHVNYFEKFDDKRTGDIHLLWQRDDELRRCIIRRQEMGYLIRQPEPRRRKLDRSFHFFDKEDEWLTALARHEQEEDVRIQNEKLEIERDRKRYNLIQPLFDLPQLFIAI